eukprot:scaffold96378_cov20-Tisochrysis_lutea.AAC.1
MQTTPYVEGCGHHHVHASVCVQACGAHVHASKQVVSVRAYLHVHKSEFDQEEEVDPCMSVCTAHPFFPAKKPGQSRTCCLPTSSPVYPQVYLRPCCLSAYQPACALSAGLPAYLPVPLLPACQPSCALAAYLQTYLRSCCLLARREALLRHNS